MALATVDAGVGSRTTYSGAVSWSQPELPGPRRDTSVPMNTPGNPSQLDATCAIS
jgi:hypothetical protein